MDGRFDGSVIVESANARDGVMLRCLPLVEIKIASKHHSVLLPCLPPPRLAAGFVPLINSGSTAGQPLVLCWRLFKIDLIPGHALHEKDLQRQ